VGYGGCEVLTWLVGFSIAFRVFHKGFRLLEAARRRPASRKFSKGVSINATITSSTGIEHRQSNGNRLRSARLPEIISGSFPTTNPQE
jgi:hypothetical protein